MGTDLNIRVTKKHKVPIVRLSGDVDAFTCGKLRETILKLLSEGSSDIIISMGKVNYIDSAGLGTLVGGLRRIVEQNGHLALCNLSAQVQRVFQITGLYKVFVVYDDDAAAIEAFTREAETTG